MAGITCSHFRGDAPVVDTKLTPLRAGLFLGCSGRWHQTRFVKASLDDTGKPSIPDAGDAKDGFRANFRNLRGLGRGFPRGDAHR